MAEGDNKNTPEQEKQITEEKKEQKSILDDMNKALEKEVNYRTRLRSMRGEEVSDAQKLADLYGQQADAAEELLELSLKKSTSEDKLLKDHEKFNNFLDKEVEKGRMLAQNAEEQKKIAEEILKAKQEIVANYLEENSEASKRLEFLTEELRKQKELTSSRQAGAAAGANLVNSLGSLIGLKPNPTLNNFFKNLATKEGRAGGLAGALEGVTAQIGDVFSLGNMIGFVASNALQLGLMFDGVASSLAATTGTGRRYVGQLAEVSAELGKQGILVEEVGQTFQSLLRDFTLFSEISDKQVQNSIATTASQLQMLGVDASTTGDNLNFFMSTLKMTGEEADATFRSMIEQGAALNIAPDQLASSFQQLQPRLAMFGRQGPDIFMKTAAAAKSLGVEVGELGSNLFALSDGMDEFSESAEKAAGLNLALGGSFVDAFDLTMAAAEGPFAQVEMLQQAFQRAGQSLGSMPFQKQQFLAKNFGMDISTLTAIMDGSIKSQEELNKQMEENPTTIEGMVKQSTSAMKDLQATLQNIFGPIGKIMEPIANVINALSSSMGDLFGPTMLGLIVVSAGKYYKNFKDNKSAADEQTESIKNLTKELRKYALLSKQKELKDLVDNQEKTKKKFAETKLGVIDTAEALKEAYELLGDDEEFNKLTDNFAGFAEELGLVDAALEAIGDQEKTASEALEKAQESTKGLDLSMAGLAGSIGMAFSAASMLVGLLEGAPASMQPAITIALGLAAALAAVALTKESIRSGPYGSILMLTALTAGMAGIMRLFKGTGGGGTATPSIGSLSTQGITTTSGVDDAIIQNDGGSTKITPINKSDQLIAAKPGGPVDEAFQRAGGGGGQIPERLVAALETIAARMAAPATTNGAGSVNVTVELDRRKMGQAVVDIMNKEMALT